MAVGTDRDNPRIPFTTRVWRRFLDRLGFRNRAFSDDDTGLVPQGSGTATDVLHADGSWATPASGGITQLTGDVTAGPGSGSVAATIPAASVTLAQIANAASSSIILGSGASGSGSSYVEIVLGTNLSMSGTTLNASGGGGVSDGDKGDITVTDSGATWTVDDGVIEYSNIQDVSATNRLLGRQTAGSGDVEEVTCTDTGFALLASSIGRDEILYGTNTDTFGVFTTTSGGRALVGVTSAAADRVPYFTGASTVAVATFTSYARTLLALASKAAVRSELACPYVEDTAQSGSALGASSTAYHEVLSFTIPADALGTTGRARLEFGLLWNVNTGNTKGRWKVNGNVVWQASGGGLPSGTGTPYYTDFSSWLANDGGTSAQKGGFRMQVAHDGTATSDSGTAYGGWAFNQNEGAGRFSDTSEDSTAAITFSFEAGFATSDASNNVTLQAARLIIEPAV